MNDVNKKWTHIRVDVNIKGKLVNMAKERGISVNTLVNMIATDVNMTANHINIDVNMAKLIEQAKQEQYKADKQKIRKIVVENVLTSHDIDLKTFDWSNYKPIVEVKQCR